MPARALLWAAGAFLVACGGCSAPEGPRAPLAVPEAILVVPEEVPGPEEVKPRQIFRLPKIKEPSAHMPSGGIEVPPPAGWQVFCRDNPDDLSCGAGQ